MPITTWINGGNHVQMGEISHESSQTARTTRTKSLKTGNSVAVADCLGREHEIMRNEQQLLLDFFWE